LLLDEAEMVIAERQRARRVCADVMAWIGRRIQMVDDIA
jgi:hypothetical protein